MADKLEGPEVVGYRVSRYGCLSNYSTSERDVPLVRKSDYDALAAKCEELERDLAERVETLYALHQGRVVEAFHAKNKLIHEKSKRIRELEAEVTARDRAYAVYQCREKDLIAECEQLEAQVRELQDRVEELLEEPGAASVKGTT